MAGNRTKTDKIHSRLPKAFNSKNNVNWRGLVEAMGQGDQQIADLIEAVREQFFIKTASRPYLDRLGANNKVSRPPFIGMDDPTFRKYIPILAWQPKQVKLIIDSLLDIFFFQESTTAFLTSDLSSPFNLEDGWELEYVVDGFKTERIEFKAEDFGDINNATAEEVVAAWNRQAKHSFAIAFTDSISQLTFIRFFTDTIGSKGSIEITGGRANIALRFNGFLEDAGTGNNTEWTVTKVGDLVTFEHTAGNAPGINVLQAGDIILSNITDNSGSFVLEEVDIANNKISFRNLFGTPGVFTQTSDRDTKFLRPFKAVVYTNDRRAVTWEVNQGEIVVEMPTSPPVVRRSLSGSSHHNGLQATVVNRVSDTEIELNDASDWPDSGTFLLRQKTEIQTRIVTPTENTVVTKSQNGRLCSPSYTDGSTIKFEYTGKSGNNLTGISPALPEAASLNEFTIDTATRDTNNILTVVTTTPHNYKVGEWAIIDGTTPSDHDGSFRITNITSPTSFQCFAFGPAGATTGGTVRVERIGMSNSGSLITLTDAQLDTGILGPNIFDQNAPFVLSSLTTNLQSQIRAGNIARTITVDANDIPNQSGQLIFDFGTERQEGPVRYFFKPTDNTIAIDPAHVFEFNHDVGSAVTMIRRQGPHQISSSGREYAPYITDTAVAREILQDLILEVKSVGIFVEFLIRFPEQLYATIDVYRSGTDPG